MKIKLTEEKLNKIIKSSIKKVLKENFENTEEKVADYVLQNWGDEIDGNTPLSEVCNMIDDAYIIVCGTELNDSQKMRNIIRILQKKVFN